MRLYMPNNVLPSKPRMYEVRYEGTKVLYEGNI